MIRVTIETAPLERPDPFSVARILGAGVLALFVVLFITGCAGRDLVTKKEEATCTVPTIVVETVDAPAPLTPGAKNEDMKARMDDLEGQLRICNARLADVPKALQRGKAKPEPAPTWTDRFLGIFRRAP